MSKLFQGEGAVRHAGKLREAKPAPNQIECPAEPLRVLPPVWRALLVSVILVVRGQAAGPRHGLGVLGRGKGGVPPKNAGEVVAAGEAQLHGHIGDAVALQQQILGGLHLVEVDKVPGAAPPWAGPRPNAGKYSQWCGRCPG